MPRSRNVVATRKRRKRILKMAKGYFGSKGTLYRTANEQVMRSLQYAYVGRKQRKRDFRKLWIQRINAACKQNDYKYSKLIHGLNLVGIEINRKMLADMAVNDPEGFKALVDIARTAEMNKPAKESKKVIKVKANLGKKVEEKPAKVEKVKEEKVEPVKEEKVEEVKEEKVEPVKEEKPKKVEEVEPEEVLEDDEEDFEDEHLSDDDLEGVEVSSEDDDLEDGEDFVYHISQVKDKKSAHYKRWKVRRSGSSKTIKHFDTQKEAIVAAKRYAESNDTRIVIHKRDGKIRKQQY